MTNHSINSKNIPSNIEESNPSISNFSKGINHPRPPSDNYSARFDINGFSGTRDYPTSTDYKYNSNNSSISNFSNNNANTIQGLNNGRGLPPNSNQSNKNAEHLITNLNSRPSQLTVNTDRVNTKNEISTNSVGSPGNASTSMVIYSHITQKKYIVGLKSKHFDTLTTKKLKSNLQRVSGVDANQMLLWYNGNFISDNEIVGQWISFDSAQDGDKNAVIMIGKDQLDQFEAQLKNLEEEKQLNNKDDLKQNDAPYPQNEISNQQNNIPNQQKEIKSSPRIAPTPPTQDIPPKNENANRDQFINNIPKSSPPKRSSPSFQQDTYPAENEPSTKHLNSNDLPTSTLNSINHNNLASSPYEETDDYKNEGQFPEIGHYQSSNEFHQENPFFEINPKSKSPSNDLASLSQHQPQQLLSQTSRLSYDSRNSRDRDQSSDNSPKQNQSETNQNLNSSMFSTISFQEKQLLIQQYEQRFQQQLTVEKNNLSKLFNEAKKAILKQANGDREMLYRENSRLREQLETLYSIPNQKIQQFDKEGDDIEKNDSSSDQKMYQINTIIANLRKQVSVLEAENEKLQQRLDFEVQVSQQTQRLKNESMPSVSDHELKWQKEKETILIEHQNEIQKLTNLRQQDHIAFVNEKEQILSEKDAKESESEEQIVHLTKEIGGYIHRIEELQVENNNLKRQIEKLQSNLQRNTLFVQSAESTIDQLKQHIERLSRGDSNTSLLLVNITQELEMVRKRAEMFEKDSLLVRERLLQETKKRKQLHNALEDMKGTIRVIVRLRPLLPNEKYSSTVQGRVEIKDDTTVTITSVAIGVKMFDFYHALGFNSKQEDVFEEVKPIIQSAIDGVNVCILAYGATGSGKTFTIHGKEIMDSFDSNPNSPRKLSPFRGILPRAAEELFRHLHDNNIWDGGPNGNLSSDTFSITCSMIELYLDDIRDLLVSTSNGERKKLELREHPTGGMFVQGVSEHPVSSADELLSLIYQGNQQKQIHKTQVHDRSSRSHTIFTINLVLHYNTGRTSIVTRSKLLFVDLAGSERISKSRAEGDRFKEAQHINKSLSALGDVIGALSKKKSHVPYRNSKLTSILQPCLGGNAKTIMFANISPSEDSLSETASTLGFASRVKKIQNNAVKNREVKTNDINT